MKHENTSAAGSTRTRELYVQFGCGMSAPSRWLNFDASPTLRFERLPILGRVYVKNKQRFPANVRYGDIVYGLPLPAGCCRAVYASHILEHLPLDDCRAALGNTYKLLMPGGIFRLIVPDLEIMARTYLQSQEIDACEKFLHATALGRTARPRGPVGFIKAYLGNSDHLWMWDFKSMSRELDSFGFTAIRQCKPGDSEDPMFSDVENPERFFEAVAIECRKPLG